MKLHKEGLPEFLTGRKAAQLKTIVIGQGGFVEAARGNRVGSAAAPSRRILHAKWRPRFLCWAAI